MSHYQMYIVYWLAGWVMKQVLKVNTRKLFLQADAPPSMHLATFTVVIKSKYDKIKNSAWFLQIIADLDRQAAKPNGVLEDLHIHIHSKDPEQSKWWISNRITNFNSYLNEGCDAPAGDGDVLDT